MRRVLPWMAAIVLTVVAGGGAVVGLNATILGPGDFVRIYLDALARGDADGALSLPGVTAGGADPRLLRTDVLTGLDDIRQTSDEDLGDGNHRITMEWVSPEGAGTTTFDVHRIGSRFGVFPEWGFAVSPVARLSLAVQHDPRFTLNGADETSEQESADVVTYAVFVPGSYVIGHDTTYLEADDVTVLANQVGAELTAIVDVRAASAFADTLDTEVRAHLLDCTTQRVLYPTGCPFGKSIPDRVVSEPTWSMTVYPTLTVVPGDTFGTWIAGPTPATAHLVVEVQSLFDGSVSTLDEDVPFQVTYTTTIVGNSLSVTESPAE